MKWKNLAQLSIHLLTRCVACDLDSPRLETFPLCASCEEALSPGLNQNLLTSSDSVSSLYSLFQLTDSAYSVLRRWKTRQGALFDHQVLKKVDHLQLKTYLQQQEIQAVIPVPQNYRRSWKMGGSPALKLAKFVSRTHGLPIISHVLTRPARGKRQAELSGWQRQQTKLDFRAKKNHLELKSVLLIDDFSTTGHTLDEAARALKKGGYRKIHSLCLAAKTVR